MSQTEVQLIKSNSVVDGDIVGMSSSKLSGALPAVSAANLTNIPAANLTGTLPAISGANLTGISAGITMLDKWFINANYSFSSANTHYVIDSGWTRSSTVAAQKSGTIGSAMTQSSGLFTFPSTGIYYIEYVALTGTSTDQLNMWSYITEGTSTSGDDDISVKASSGDSGTMNTVTHSVVFDVTDVSTRKIFFRGYANTNGCYLSGNTGGTRTSVTFIRLGDT